MAIPLTLLAMLIEVIVGYPDRLARAMGHPVMWIGGLIGLLDRGLNRETLGPGARRAGGAAAILVVVVVACGLAYLIERGLLALSYGFIGVALIASMLIAQRSLHRHVMAVAVALEREGVAGGRAAVAHIVGRDTAALDEAGVARAAIESLAENFSDAVVAPVLWLAVAGLPGAVGYKAINTADSMIGHRTARHEAFGSFAARLDDLVNLPASRLAALIVIAAAVVTPGASPARAWRAVRRDASRHRSPNAGYPEAAFAGALGLSLAGPRHYGGVQVDDAPMGDGRYAATSGDIRAALALYRRADAILIALVGILAAIVIALVPPI